MAGGQCENDDRKRRREPDQSESERGMCSLVQLPAECHLEHLPADYAGDASESVKPEIPVAKRRVGIVSVGYLRSLGDWFEFVGTARCTRNSAMRLPSIAITSSSPPGTGTRSPIFGSLPSWAKA